MSLFMQRYPNGRHPGRDAARNDQEALDLASACLEACPKLTKADMDRVPGVFKAWYLSPSQQSEVERLEDTDEMYNLNRVVAYPDLQVLWKTCLRVFRYSPNSLLSVINYLQYGGENKQVGNAIFSTAFSKLLSSLIVHPVWDCNYRKLRVALQFVVMCRIESGERWPVSRRDTFDCQALELLRERFDELEPGSVSEKLRQALALTPVEEEFPAFLLTISQYVNQKTTDSDINPVYRGLLAYPVEIRDLKSIEQALDNYAWMHETWGISTQRIWEASKVQRGTSTTEFPKDNQLKEYIPSAVRHIYGYVVRVGVSPTPSPGVDAEGSEGSQISWLDSDGSSDEGVYPTMSGAIDSSGRQRNADSEALRRLEASNNELRADHEALRADYEALQERVKALERSREVETPFNEALVAENERLRRQRNALRARVRRQEGGREES